jgi:hypothetical protein
VSNAGRGGGRHGAPHNNDGTFAPDPTPYAPSEEAPRLDGTIGTNLAFIAWAVSEKAAGRMSDRSHDSLIAGAKAEQSGIRTKHGLHEIDELRSLVERQETAIAELTRHETQDRYSAGTGVEQPFGRVRMPPDGEPH